MVSHARCAFAAGLLVEGAAGATWRSSGERALQATLLHRERDEGLPGTSAPPLHAVRAQGAIPDVRSTFWCDVQRVYSEEAEVEPCQRRPVNISA